MSEIKHVGKLRCALENTPEELFFSLVDYRNNLFTSNDPEKIIEFYNGFHNRDQLIQWMKERPKGASYIHEVEGNKDIIVVIPTADFNGKYARTCREEIFKGLHMVFVESGENPDPYFNYAHNCNVGIKRAMEYNPKWVVVSNDDIKTERIENLIRLLETATEKYYVPKNTHSNNEAKVFSINKAIAALYALHQLINYGPQTCKLSIKVRKSRTFYGKSILFCQTHGLIFKLLLIFATSISPPYKNFADFGVFDSNVLKENIYNEEFINGHEDGELCIRLANRGVTANTLDFLADSLEGGGNSLGRGGDILRILRDFSNLLLLTTILNRQS